MLLKYADDFTLCKSVDKNDSHNNLQSNLSSITSQSTAASLFLNPSKCVSMTFSLRKHADPPPLVVNDQLIPQVSNFRYIGVILSSDLKWSEHIQHVCKKLLQVSFVLRRLKNMCAPQTTLLTILNSCVLPIVTYCSPVILPGLLDKDFNALRRSLKYIAKCCLISLHDVISLVLKNNFSACSRMATSILSDATHPLHACFALCLSKRPSRRSYVILPSRTSAYRNSLIPYLSRFLTNPDNVIEELRRKLT